MKAYKVIVQIIDFENLVEDGVREELLNARFANDCISLQIKSTSLPEIVFIRKKKL